MSDDELLLETFKAVQKIADLAFQYWSSDLTSRCWLIDHRKKKVNPFYHVTVQGIFLEIDGFLPDSLWTPWGEWEPWGGGVGDEKLLFAFLANLTSEFYSERAGGCKIYQVIKFREVNLPPVQIYAGNYDAEKLKKSWEKMEERYNNLLLPT